MTDTPDTTPQAPAAPVLTFVKRSASFSTLDVSLDDGMPMPDAGGEVDLTISIWASLVEREILVIAPPPATKG